MFNKKLPKEEFLQNSVVDNGGGGIRTHGALADTLVFKTRALNHSTTPPEGNSVLLNLKTIT